jgi:signal recognition particle subunit SRP14
MRKRDKKKEKAKAEFVAKKRKELYEDVVPGGRRAPGAGEGEGKKKLGHRQRVCFAGRLREGSG